MEVQEVRAEVKHRHGCILRFVVLVDKDTQHAYPVGLQACLQSHMLAIQQGKPDLVNQAPAWLLLAFRPYNNMLLHIHQPPCSPPQGDVHLDSCYPAD